MTQIRAAMAAAVLAATSALAAAAQDAPQPDAPRPDAAHRGAICARGATAGPIPLTHVLSLEAYEDQATLSLRTDLDAFVDPDATDPEQLYYAFIFAQAIEWPGVLADRAASLPKSAHDLPWLILLAQIEMTQIDPIWTLTQGSESILTVDLLPLLDRNGLTEEARVLRTAMALFPDWGLDPSDRTRQVMTYDGTVVDERLKAGLEAASRAWPTGQNGATQAALKMINADPDLRRRYDAQLSGLDDATRLDWLIRQLWDNCTTDWWTPEEADRHFASMGAAQAALLMMDNLSYTAEPPSLYGFFEDLAATSTPALARLLKRRGLMDLAAALDSGMALFPAPFPRNVEDRWAAMGQMDAPTLSRMDDLMPLDAFERLRKDMALLAYEAGLMTPD